MEIEKSSSYWELEENGREYCTVNILITFNRRNVKSNQNRFPLDFRHTFTVSLPSVTWILDNSNLPLTRSGFCFPSDHFYIILPLITRTMFWVLKTLESRLKKAVYWRPKRWVLNFSLTCCHSLLVEADVVCHKSNVKHPLLLKTVKRMLYLGYVFLSYVLINNPEVSFNFHLMNDLHAIARTARGDNNNNTHLFSSLSI